MRYFTTGQRSDVPVFGAHHFASQLEVPYSYDEIIAGLFPVLQGLQHNNKAKNYIYSLLEYCMFLSSGAHVCALLRYILPSSGVSHTFSTGSIVSLM